jgi:transposase
VTDEAASLRALAKQYGVSPTTVAKMVRKAQQDFERQQPKMIMGRDGKRRPDRRCDTSTRDARIIGLRHEGYSLREIASEVSCSVGTVHRIVHRAES